MNSTGLVVATRGPILLITLGLLLAADRFGQVEFFQTWPVLLIVFGLTKLLERMGAGRSARGGATQ